eukprot:3540462-Rhodomonas_salina.1
MRRRFACDVSRLAVFGFLVFFDSESVLSRGGQSEIPASLCTQVARHDVAFSVLSERLVRKVGGTRGVVVCQLGAVAAQVGMDVTYTICLWREGAANVPCQQLRVPCSAVAPRVAIPALGRLRVAAVPHTARRACGAGAGGLMRV